MHFLTAYGLSICSYLPLPELVAGCELPVQVNILTDTIVRTPLEEAHQGTCFRVTDQEVGLFWNDIGTILVRYGSEIIVDPYPGVEDRVLRLLILGPALGLVLHQRGFLVLHASAVDVNGGVVAFLGGSGWGKSTTAGAMRRRGHGLVADDILALEIDNDDTVVAYPGFPQLKLWPEAAASLGEQPEMLPRLHPRFEKRASRQVDDFPHEPLPLKRLYILAEGDRSETKALKTQEAFVELVRHSFVASLLESTGTGPHHLEQCSTLVQCVPIRRLNGKRSLAELPELARIIEKDLFDEE